MEPLKQFAVEGSCEEMSSFQAGIHPTSLEFNFVQQPIIQPSPVQDVISILEKHLEEEDKLLHARTKEDKNSSGNKNLDASSTDGEVIHQVDNLLVGNKLAVERTSSGKIDTNSNFKYVMVDQNGAPDWSKVLHLDKNIIQEVCEKHGISMDEVGKSSKKPKKKKKSKSLKKSKTEKNSGQQDKNIPCSLCEKTFCLKRHLRDHMRYHSEKKFKCTECEYVTVRQKELQYHLNSHTGKRPFVCDICNKGFRHPTVLTSHKKTHRGHTGTVSCDKCKMEFEQPHQLDRHMQTHNEDRPHHCFVCTSSFKRAMDLRRHITLYHSEVAWASMIDEIAPKKSSPAEGDVKCAQCSRSFQTTQGLKQHKRRTHAKISNLLTESGDGEQKFSCQQCHKQFDSLKVLTKHKFTHSTLRPYTCSECGRSFKRQWELHKHKLTHSKQPSVPCPYTQCNAQFLSRSNLRRHIMRMHCGNKKTAPKPYRCEICLRPYARRSELAEHQNIHTGNRPYICDTCGKTFSFRSSLACHKKLHEVEGAILCDICGKRFGSRIRMREHRVIHTGEKPHVCQHCGTSYKYPSNLRWHLNKAHKKGPCGGKKQRPRKAALIQTNNQINPVHHLLTQLKLAAMQYQTETSQNQVEPHGQESEEHPVMQLHYDTGEVHQLTTAPLQYCSTVNLPPNVQLQNIPIRQEQELSTDMMAVGVAEFVLQTSESSRILQTEDGSLIIETPMNQLQTAAETTS